MKKILDMLKENGQYSLTRVLAVFGYFAFLVGTAYLILNNRNWAGYDTFASLTGGGGCATQLVNKFINGKYNTPLGEAGKPVFQKRGDV